MLIIIDKSDLTMADRIRMGLKGLMNKNVPVDILVYTKEEVERKKNHPSTLANKVLTKGVKLYEAA